MGATAANDGRIVVPDPAQAVLPGGAVLRLPGVGGLRLLHATRNDRAPGSAQRQEHRHDLWHCVAYASGRGTCLLDGRVCAVRAPWLVLTGPGQPHSFTRLPGEDLAYHEITFAAERPGAAAGWDGLLRAWSGAPADPPASAACPRALADAVGAIAGRIGALVRAGGASAALELHWQLAGLFHALWQHLVAAPAGAPPADPLDAARAFLEAHAEDPIDLAAVAAAAGLSRTHLARAFAARFGLAPMRWRRRELLRRAALLLRTSDEPVAAVAARLGFADARHFARIFAAEHGCAPARWRRG